MSNSMIDNASVCVMEHLHLHQPPRTYIGWHITRKAGTQARSLAHTHHKYTKRMHTPFPKKIKSLLNNELYKQVSAQTCVMMFLLAVSICDYVKTVQWLFPQHNHIECLTAPISYRRQPALTTTYKHSDRGFNQPGDHVELKTLTTIPQPLYWQMRSFF